MPKKIHLRVADADKNAQTPKAGVAANTPLQGDKRAAGILKQPTTFNAAANAVTTANNLAQEASLSDSDEADKFDKMRKNQPSTLDIIHKELGTK